MGPQWSATRAYWDDPTPERQAEATAHLTFEGTRDQYLGGVPADIAERIDPAGCGRRTGGSCRSPAGSRRSVRWCSTIAAMSREFGEIADYLDRWQPPALMLWGRHDIFFDPEETLSG